MSMLVQSTIADRASGAVAAVRDARAMAMTIITTITLMQGACG